jgi:hypothetical protein
MRYQTALIPVEEGVGFEPTEVLSSPVFKTGAISHSANLPCRGTSPQDHRTTCAFLSERSIQ